MNHQERQMIKLAYSQLSAYYGRQLQDFVLEMYLQDLEGLSFEEIKNAMFLYRRNVKNKSFPLPNEIRAIINPKQDQDAEAKEAASRLISAIGKFGYTNNLEAKKYIGDLGWRIVERWGGWKYLCENLGTTIDITTFQAQARDVAKATLIRSEQNLLDVPPAITSGNNKKLLELMNGNDLNKAIDIKGVIHANE